MRSLDYYLDLIPSEHKNRPKFIAMLSAFLQPLIDNQAVIEHLPIDFDIDYAVGVQLDAVGVRLNRNRFLNVPLQVYFSLGVEGLGLGQGYLKGPNDPDSGLTMLPDEPYRTVLKAVVGANQWDGTIPGAYAAWAVILDGTPFAVLIQDYGNDSMAVALVGATPDAVTKALFTTNELVLKPAGVRLYHLVPTIYPASVPGGTPLFGLGVDNNVIGGLGRGQLARTILVE